MENELLLLPEYAESISVQKLDELKKLISLVRQEWMLDQDEELPELTS